MAPKHPLIQHAENIAESFIESKLAIKKHINELETKLSTAKLELKAAVLSEKNLLHFSVTRDGNFQCPSCWVKKAVRFDLTPVENATGDRFDHFECKSCGSHYEWEA